VRGILAARVMPVRAIGTCCVYIYLVLLWTMIAGFRDAEDREALDGGQVQTAAGPPQPAGPEEAVYPERRAGAGENLTVRGQPAGKSCAETATASTVSVSTIDYRICFVWRDGNAHEVGSCGLSLSLRLEEVEMPANAAPNASLIHPGEILLTEFMEPLGLTLTGWPRTCVCRRREWGILCAASERSFRRHGAAAGHLFRLAGAVLAESAE